MSIVYVVSFVPADDQGGVGGFFWWPESARNVAVHEYVKVARESAREVRKGHPGQIVRLVMVDVPPPAEVARTEEEDAEGITEWIEYMALDGVESHYPAERQYIPPTTIPEHVPTGGIARSRAPYLQH